MNKVLPGLIMVLTIPLSYLLSYVFIFRTDRYIKSALGYKAGGGKFFTDLKNRGPIKRLYDRAYAKMSAAGKGDNGGVFYYLLIKYAASTVLAVSVIGRSVLTAVSVWLILYKIPDILLNSEIRKNNRILQRYLYKIYRFLNNQISSGVRVADAIKSVYSVVDEPSVRTGLAEAAAKFQLTNDIDSAMDDFKKRFRSAETDTLRVVLKQSLNTGSNTALLEKQEQYLFGKYFNLIQAETDKYRYRSFLAAVIFMVILCVLFFVPIFMDLQASILNMKI